ncbi:DUF3693 domain-containing protein [Vibrio profundum]|uniref:DUF3693 domain-containing protein n=1 Tax=Vibrio profundum TaxID=2910247 RepID=UPI003D0C015C
MYQSQLLDAYKKAKNYIQDKQIAHDLDLPKSRIYEMRKGKRYISDSEAVFLAKEAGIDPELALLGCHADRNENPAIKAMWETIAKKFDSRGLRAISMASAGLALVLTSDFAHASKCALCILC